MSQFTTGFFDAKNEKIVLQRVDASGARIDAAGYAIMDLATLGGRGAGWVWLHYLDADNSCAPMKMLVFGTAPEPDV